MTEPWEVMNLILERRRGERRFVKLTQLTIQEWAAAYAHWDRRQTDRRRLWRGTGDRRKAA